MNKTAYDFTLPALDGSVIDLSQWRERALIIVNTASKCGFTPQYEALQALWKRGCQLNSSSPVIIGVPSGDFGGQEYNTAQETRSFCTNNYGVTFPLSAKSHVKGTQAIPLFQWLAQEGGYFSLPRWNFYKYLINHEGRLQSWFTPLTSPDKKRFFKAVNRLMKAD